MEAWTLPAGGEVVSRPLPPFSPSPHYLPGREVAAQENLERHPRECSNCDGLGLICAKCKRPCHPWPLHRPGDHCAPKSWARCISHKNAKPCDECTS